MDKIFRRKKNTPKGQGPDKYGRMKMRNVRCPKCYNKQTAYYFPGEKSASVDCRTKGCVGGHVATEHAPYYVVEAPKDEKELKEAVLEVYEKARAKNKEVLFSSFGPGKEGVVVEYRGRIAGDSWNGDKIDGRINIIVQFFYSHSPDFVSKIKLPELKKAAVPFLIFAKYVGRPQIILHSQLEDDETF